MKSGADLGKAIKEAMRLKVVTQKVVAAEFGVKQPSVSEWVKYGRIDKSHLSHLLHYFADVVGPSHWGLGDESGPLIPASATGAPLGVSQALEVLGIALAAAPISSRPALAMNLAEWAKEGGQGPWPDAVLTLLQAAPSKHARTA